MSRKPGQERNAMSYMSRTEARNVLTSLVEALIGEEYDAAANAAKILREECCNSPSTQMPQIDKADLRELLWEIEAIPSRIDEHRNLCGMPSLYGRGYGHDGQGGQILVDAIARQRSAEV